MESQDNSPNSLLALPTETLRKTQEDIRVEIEKRFWTAYNSIMLTAVDLVNAKSHDYNRGGVRIQDHFHDPLYALGCLKQNVLRLESLLLTGNRPNFEALSNSIHDAINHSAFLGAILKLEGRI